MRFLVIFLIFFTISFAKMEEKKIKNMIGSMLIVGFHGSKVDKNSKIIQNINLYHLGGVVLFDTPKNKTNIKNPRQLKKLISDLKKFSDHKILICIDEEGGKVSRLKKKNGFLKIPSAKRVGEKNNKIYSKKIYSLLAKELSFYGINCNFAPVVDIALNPKNKVIVKMGRSYGKNPNIVTTHAEIFIKEMKKRKIISVLKHFPGHGSSFGDTHKGFTDVTNTWKKKELIPYKILIEKDLAPMIMTAHIYNTKLDKEYPSTLSYKINTLLLRKKLGFKGVLISDDMEMGAIRKYYSLDKALPLAINSGVDMLLFANRQEKGTDIEKIIKIIYDKVKNKEISLKRIKESKQRIKKILSSID